MAYCQKLTDHDRASGLLPTGCLYSLPSDAQYDIFVGDADLTDSVTSLKMNPIRIENTEVGTKPANEYGLYDTRGEVWEWCMDWYQSSMNGRMIRQKNAWANNDGGGQKYKVLRGGSWIDVDPEYLDVSFRSSADPGIRDFIIGFRCIVVSPP
jgi:formylglycine-generating enzyme required for sulfatase activity